VVDLRKVADSNNGRRREAVAATAAVGAAAVPISIKVSQDHEEEFEMGHAERHCRRIAMTIFFRGKF